MNEPAAEDVKELAVGGVLNLSTRGPGHYPLSLSQSSPLAGLGNEAQVGGENDMSETTAVTQLLLEGEPDEPRN